MKQNDAVTYIDSKGKKHKARVLEVVGTGASYYKRLDLVLDGDEKRLGVKHELDAEKGHAHWVEVDPGAPPVIGEAPPEARRE